MLDIEVDHAARGGGGQQDQPIGGVAREPTTSS
jgi:hypothetical protein